MLKRKALLLTIGIISLPILVPNAVYASAHTVESTSNISTMLSATKILVFYSADAKFGIKNSASIKNLQKQLIVKGFATKYLKATGVTGNYLQETRASVMKVQKYLGYYGNDADGILGSSSAKYLGLTWTQKNIKPSKPSPKNLSNPLTALQLKQVLLTAGFREPNIRTAWALAMRESRAYPKIVGPKNSNGTQDYGLFQINDVHRSHVDFTKILDPLYNAQVAYGLTNNGTDFSAWGIGTTGWAGYLKQKYPQSWQRLQDEMLVWKIKYPN